MTGFMHEQEFSRKAFVKGGGALIVGFTVAGAGLAGRADAAAGSPTSFAAPDPNQVDTYVVIHGDNTATIYTGRSEVGQGTSTGFLQIAGEELNMDMSQLRFVSEDTGLTPNQGGTGGSSGVRVYGPQVRAAAASAYQALLGLASSSLGVPVSGLSVKSGVVSGGGKTVTYGQLLGDKQFNVAMPASYNLTQTKIGSGDPEPVYQVTVGLAAGAPGTKPVGEYTLVGTSVPRIELPAKVTGTYTYVHNIRVPGMLHGRIVRPRGQGAYGDGTNPAVISVDKSSIAHLPNVQVVQKGNFLGVVAPLEYDAIEAAAQLKVTWAEMPTIASSGNQYQPMRAQDSAGKATAYPASATEFAYNINPGQVDAALASAAHVVSESYAYGYDMHAPIGPQCAIADVTPTGALIFSNTQSAYGTQAFVAGLLNLPTSAVRVKFYEGSSQFGRGGATGINYNEPVGAAALLSQAVGKPVRLQMMRWDSHGWEFYAPLQLMDIRGGIDANGKIVAIDYTTFSPASPAINVVQQEVGLPLGPESLGGANGHGIAGAQYNRPVQRATVKSVPLFNTYFKTAAMRSVLGPQTAWGYEQMIDELAYAAKMDPYEFRAQNLVQVHDPTRPWFAPERWMGVMTPVVQASGWKPRVAASQLSSAVVVSGRGISITPHTDSLSAVVAEIEVNKKTGKVIAKQLYMAQDAGLGINPGLLENQMVGGSVMAASRVLYEELAFNNKHVTSLDWVSYPIMRFKDAPKVTAIVVQRTDQLSKGAGEVPMPATVAAIANAFFDATGVRMREAPLSPGRVRAALKAAGVS